jgi:tetratricopeptide (TPR) repeat protein
MRAEQRGRESLALRQQAVERMSRLAMSRSQERWPLDAEELHRACAEEYARLAEAGIDPTNARLRRAEHISWEAFEKARQGRYYNCKTIAETAIAAFEGCLDEQPASVRARQGLFEARYRLAVAIHRLGRSEDALQMLDDLIIQAPDVFGQDWSPDGKSCLSLRDLHHTRASALLILKRYAESAAEYDEALRFDDGSKWSDLIILRASLLARTGRAAEALEILHAQLRNPHLSPWNVLNAGCAYALASIADDLPPAARAKAAESAMVALRRALAADPQLRGAIETDPDLDHFRSRPDFQALLAEK